MLIRIVTIMKILLLSLAPLSTKLHTSILAGVPAGLGSWGAWVSTSFIAVSFVIEHLVCCRVFAVLKLPTSSPVIRIGHINILLSFLESGFLLNQVLTKLLFKNLVTNFTWYGTIVNHFFPHFMGMPANKTVVLWEEVKK